MRRLLAVLLGLAVACVPASAARAATPQIRMDLPPRTTIVAGGEVWVWPSFTAGPGYTKHTMTGVTITYEIGATLSGAKIGNPGDDPDWGCVAHGPGKMVCAVPVPLPVSDKPWTSFALPISAGTVPAGRTGDLTVTLTANKIPKVVKHSKIAIAEQVHPSSTTDRSGVPPQAAPGTAFDLTAPLSLSSGASDEPVIHGIVLAFDLDHPFAAGKQFSNCYYRDGQVTACLFDRDLPPGGEYETVVPLRIRPDTNAGPTAWNAGWTWLTPGDLDDLVANRAAAGLPGLGTRGGGDPVGLRVVEGESPAPARPGVKQTVGKVNDGDWAGPTVVVTGEPRRTDLAAVGARVTAPLGATVSVPVAVHNNGPVTIDRTYDYKPASTEPKQATAALFTLPPGVAVVTVPAGCMPAGGDGTGPEGTQYICWSPPVMPAGQTYTWTFRLKVTKLIPDAEGRVESNPPACFCQGYPDDTDRSNDAAPVILNAGVPTPAPPTGGHRGLPITGPQTAGIAASAAALILAGLAAFVLARRRRTRYVP